MKIFKLAILTVLAALPQLAHAEAIHFVYDIKAGDERGMTVGRFTVDFTVNGNSYTGRATREMTGPIGGLLQGSQNYSYNVSGNIVNGVIRPVSYDHTGGSRRRTYRAQFAYDASGNSTDIVTTASQGGATIPPNLGNPVATAAQKRDAIDQLSMFLSMLKKAGNACPQTQKAFIDGHSRADFVFSNVEGQGPNICNVRFTPIAGFSDPQVARTLSFIFERRGENLVPVRFQMPIEPINAGPIHVNTITLQLRE